MVVAETIRDVRRAVREARERGRMVRLVPTMGALHEGHASLIRAARADGGFVAVSVFVNPTQFGPNEDYRKYPRPIERDLDVCRHEGVDLVFAPAAAEMYPDGPSGPATSTASARSSRNSWPSSGPMPPTSARRTPSNSPSSAAWSAT